MQFDPILRKGTLFCSLQVCAGHSAIAGVCLFLNSRLLFSNCCDFEVLDFFELLFGLCRKLGLFTDIYRPCPLVMVYARAVFGFLCDAATPTSSGGGVVWQSLAYLQTLSLLMAASTIWAGVVLSIITNQSQGLHLGWAEGQIDAHSGSTSCPTAPARLRQEFYLSIAPDS